MGNASGKAYQDSPGGRLSRSELERLQRRFSRLSHGQAQISVRQLVAVPELSGNLFVQRLFELHDEDGDGVISYEEFRSALFAVRRLASSSPEESVALAFQLYDLNGDGFVSVEEMVQVMARTSAAGLPTEQLEAEVRHAVAAHDVDSDRCLSFVEFRDLVLASVPGLPQHGGGHKGGVAEV